MVQFSPSFSPPLICLNVDWPDVREQAFRLENGFPFHLSLLSGLCTSGCRQEVVQLLAVVTCVCVCVCVFKPTQITSKEFHKLLFLFSG